MKTEIRTAAERLWTGFVIGTAVLIVLGFWTMMRWGFGSVIEMSTPEVATVAESPKGWQVVAAALLLGFFVNRVWVFGLQPVLTLARLPLSAGALWGFIARLWWVALRGASALALPMLALGLDLDMPWVVLPVLATVAVWEFVKDKRAGAVDHATRKLQPV